MDRGKGAGRVTSLDAILRPMLLRFKRNKYLELATSLGKITVGNCSPALSLEELDKVGRILVVAPHPDDDILGCGGTIRKICEKGAHVRTVYFTDGGDENGRVNEPDRVKVRRAEAEAGQRVLGCDDLVFLNFPDGHLRSNHNTVGAACAVLNDYRPDTIFVPFILDNHPDHIETAIIVANALKKVGGEVLCYCYEVWTPLFPNTLIDITETMDDKMRAMEAHSSQLETLNVKECVRGLNTYRALGMGKNVKACEAFYRCSRKEFIKMVLHWPRPEHPG